LTGRTGTTEVVPFRTFAGNLRFSSARAHFALQLAVALLHFGCSPYVDFPIKVSLVPDFLEKLRGFVVPQPGQTPNLFQASATVFSIAAVYLYFAGYLFCYFYYFGNFGVTLESLDLSTQFYLMRAYTCLGSSVGVCFLLVMLLIIAAYLRGRLRTSITLLAMLAAFPALFYISSHRAWTEYQEKICNPANTIEFRFKEKSEKAPQATVSKATAPDAAAKTETGNSQPQNEPPPDVVNPQELMALEQGDKLSLLLETKDRLVVYRKSSCHPFGDAGPFVQPQAEVYTLLRSDLEFSKVMPKGAK
jgi:hypothetical protein